MCDSVVSFPLASLQELVGWSAKVPEVLVGQPIQRAEIADGKPRTLVCHDMAGGYLEDRFADGYVVSNGENPYFLNNWWYIDTFVYFSHNLVTIPPVGWINAAHKHGTKVLGTFITEWDDGALTCGRVFSDPHLLNRVVEQLVLIAQTHRFDGWLVNIENPIEMKNLPDLYRFVRTLTKRCHNMLGPAATVVWYDSVISTTGRLKWQDELNALNSRYFDASDGILLNYGWTEASLQYTSQIAASKGRKHEVYVGVDVFGRGCFGGGGFNCCKALELIHKYSLSVGLFAPGWVREKLPKEDFPKNNFKFWWLLRDYTHCRRLQAGHLPVFTNFGLGSKCSPENRLFNLSWQELQPHYMCQHVNSTEFIKDFDNFEIMDSDDIPGPFMKVILRYKVTHFRLFCTDITLDKGYKLSLQYFQSNAAVVLGCSICLLFLRNDNLVDCFVSTARNLESVERELTKLHPTREISFKSTGNPTEDTGFKILSGSVSRCPEVKLTAIDVAIFTEESPESTDSYLLLNKCSMLSYN